MPEQDVSGAGVDAEPRDSAVVHQRPDAATPVTVPAPRPDPPAGESARADPPADDAGSDPPAEAESPAPFRAEPYKAEPYKAEPYKAEPYKAPYQAQPFKVDPYQGDSYQAVPFRAEPLKVEPLEAVSPAPYRSAAPIVSEPVRASEPVRPIKPFRLADQDPGPDQGRGAGSDPGREQPRAARRPGSDPPVTATSTLGPAAPSSPAAPFAVGRPTTFRSAAASQSVLAGPAADGPSVRPSDPVEAPGGAGRPATTAADEPVPREQTPHDQAARDQAARDQAARDQAARDQAARDQAARDQAARDQAIRGQAAWEQAAWEQAAWEQVAREQVAREQAAWDQTARDQTAWDQAARDQAVRDQATRVPAQRLGRFASRQAAGRTAPAHHAVAMPDGGRLLPIVASGFALSGIALTAAALTGADRSLGTARTLALAAAGVAAVGALVAVGTLLIRVVAEAAPRGRARRSAGRSLAGVGAVLPGALLVVALGLAGAAAAVTVVGPAVPTVPRLALSTARDGDGGRVVRVEATVGGLVEGDPIAVSLSVLGDGATLLSSAVQRASGAATDTVRLSGTVLDGESVQVDVNLPGRLCQAVVPVRTAVTAADTRVICRSR